MSIRELAAAAVDEQVIRRRDDRDRLRRDAYKKVSEYWESQWRDIAEVAIPPYEECVWETVATDRSRYGDSVNGIRIDVDDVRFLYVTDYQEGGLRVVVACPLCGCDRAVNFYGLASLGEVLKRGHDHGHHCLERETRILKLTITSCARDAKVSEREILERAGW